MGRTRTKYVQVYEGQWLRHRRRGEIIRCCDCGLVHTYNFRVRRGRLEAQTFRNNRATAAVRRATGIKVVQKKKKRK